MRIQPTAFSVCITVIVLLACGKCNGQIKESTAQYDSGGTSIRYELYEPAAAGTYPGVVLLPGTFGLIAPWGDDIRSFARGLAEKNIVALIPQYFDRTGTVPGPATTAAITELVARHSDDWNSAINDGIAFLAAHSGVDSDRIGLLGFSLGGNRALTLAMQPARSIRIQRVAEFFAPTTRIPLSGDVTLLPLLQIHHGDDSDKFVPPNETEKLVRRLERAGKVRDTDFKVFWYPGAGHGFEGDDLKNSRKETILFFEAL